MYLIVPKRKVVEAVASAARNARWSNMKAGDSEVGLALYHDSFGLRHFWAKSYMELDPDAPPVLRGDRMVMREREVTVIHVRWFVGPTVYEMENGVCVYSEAGAIWMRLLTPFRWLKTQWRTHVFPDRS